MADLFNISFTTKKMVKKLDSKGNIISETELATPITMTMLPHSAAMSYSGCDNFEIERYVPENAGIRTSRRTGVGNGTKKMDWGKVDRGASSAQGKTGVSKSSGGSKTVVQRAAEIGDMAAAIND